MLVNYYYATNYPKTTLEDNNIYRIPVFMGQGFRSGLTGWFWLRVFQEAAVKMLARRAVSALKAQLDLAAPHGDGSLTAPLAGVSGPPWLLHSQSAGEGWVPPQGCVNVLKTWWLLSSEPADPRETAGRSSPCLFVTVWSQKSHAFPFGILD